MDATALLDCAWTDRARKVGSYEDNTLPVLFRQQYPAHAGSVLSIKRLHVVSDSQRVRLVRDTPFARCTGNKLKLIGEYNDFVVVVQLLWVLWSVCEPFA